MENRKLTMKIEYWRAKLRSTDNQATRDECVKQLELLDKELKE